MVKLNFCAVGWLWGRNAAVAAAASLPRRAQETGQSDSATPFSENDVQAFQGREEREGGGQASPGAARRTRSLRGGRGPSPQRGDGLLPAALPEAAGLKSRARKGPGRGGGRGAQPGQTPVPTDPGAAGRPGGPFRPDVQDR